MAVMVIMSTVRATFRLERSVDFSENRAEAGKHLFDHMVRPDMEGCKSNLRRQMTIAEMPSKPYKLARIFMPHLDNRLCGRLNHEPPPILELQAVSVGHCNCFREVEKDTFALIRAESNAAAMARVKVKSKSTRRPFFGPVPGGTMNGSTMDGHIST